MEWFTRWSSVKTALESHNNNNTLSYFLDDITCERICLNTMGPTQSENIVLCYGYFFCK